jgi:hypothetical protein
MSAPEATVSSLDAIADAEAHEAGMRAADIAWEVYVDDLRRSHVGSAAEGEEFASEAYSEAYDKTYDRVIEREEAR